MPNRFRFFCLSCFATLALATLPLPSWAQNAGYPACTEQNTGAIITIAGGGLYTCYNNTWVHTQEALPPPVSVGDWQFNDKTKRMEYFDGKNWVPVLADEKNAHPPTP